MDMNRAKESYLLVNVPTDGPHQPAPGLEGDPIIRFTTRVLGALRSLVSREWNFSQASGSIYGAILALAGKPLEPIYLNDVWDIMDTQMHLVLHAAKNLTQAEDELRRFAWNMRMEKEDEPSPGGADTGDR